MKLRTLAGVLALGVGAAALVPSTARADDRGWRDHRSGRRVEVVRSHRYVPHRRSVVVVRPYRTYRTYRYGYPYYGGYYDGGYYDGYYDSGYYDGGYYDGGYYDGGYYSPYYPYRRVPRRVVVVPSFRYHRPLLGVRVGGPRFGVWLGW